MKLKRDSSIILPIKIEGKMSKQGADKVAIIIALSKAIAIFMSTATGLVIALTFFLKFI